MPLLFSLRANIDYWSIPGENVRLMLFASVPPVPWVSPAPVLCVAREGEHTGPQGHKETCRSLQRNNHVCLIVCAVCMFLCTHCSFLCYCVILSWVVPLHLHQMLVVMVPAFRGLGKSWHPCRWR